MRIALLSDIHEDIISLRRAFLKINKIGVDQIYCLGDISGFSVPFYHHRDSRDASACLSLLKEFCDEIIVGNHDLHAARQLPSLDQGIVAPENWYEMDFTEKSEYSNNNLWLYEKNELDPLYSKADKKLLKSLPEMHILEAHGAKVLLTHYVFPNVSGAQAKFFHTPADHMEHFDFMRQYDCDFSFVGHAHSEGIYCITERKVIEKGFHKKIKLRDISCCVIPSIAGNRKGGFAIFDTEALSIEARRI